MLRNALEPWHILVVVLVMVVLFGSRKLPDTARALGKSMRILKSEARAMKADGPAEQAGGQAVKADGYAVRTGDQPADNPR
ncbi:Sec-independent protein translocase subunit TatA [Streptomyces roseifaciens]